NEKTTQAYQQQFSQLFTALNSNPDFAEWMQIYKQLVYWELEISKADSPEMKQVVQSQKAEANTEFFKFIVQHYREWIQGKIAAPVMSHTLLQNKVIPFLTSGKPIFLVLIDNLRFDQWKAIQPAFTEVFRLLEEDTFYSILPTATAYSRNAIFSGLLPVDIKANYPDAWKLDHEDGSKNQHEEMFLRDQLKRLGRTDIKISFTKVAHHQSGQELVQNIHNMLQNDLNVIVYNFIDMLSHARTEIELMKELASDERSYRSITASWFEHSPLLQALKKIAHKNIQLVLATDHGSIQVKNPSKVVGDRESTTNIRYKHGRNLDYEAKHVLAIRDPREAGLPAPNIHSSYVFAKDDIYLCYPNNYNHYVQYYRNTFQHGGISLEEMIIPVVRMESR
ncbi:MAG: PglZ domain-containing protein, partial [Chitinophagaceae bacterium]